MNRLIEACGEIDRFFRQKDIPYVIIGGMALQHWGQPRFTRDVDVTILVPPPQEEKTLKKILTVFTPRIPQALTFALKHRVCLLRSRNGCEIDLSLGVPGYEEEVMKRAVEHPWGANQNLRLCSAEDLIIHKAVAARPQDGADIESVIHRQGKKLDIIYIRYWLQQFSQLLEKKEILQTFEIFWEDFISKQ